VSSFKDKKISSRRLSQIGKCVDYLISNNAVNSAYKIVSKLYNIVTNNNETVEDLVAYARKHKNQVANSKQSIISRQVANTNKKTATKKNMGNNNKKKHMSGNMVTKYRAIINLNPDISDKQLVKQLGLIDKQNPLNSLRAIKANHTRTINTK